jgi:FKBP-type peptidyl-prolyl cis-trans isomerase SlyD
MATEKNVVEKDQVVSLHYTLRDEDGDIIDSSAGRDPLQFIQGAGQIISGLEESLYGMQVGDEKQVTVEPENAYGQVDPDAFQLVPRDRFPDDLDLKEGMGFRMRDSETGEVIVAYVEKLRPDGVVLDLNHPLAGETLDFQVRVEDVRQATNEELQHGHVHDGEDGHEEA